MISSLGFSLSISSQREDDIIFVARNKALFDSVIVDLKLGYSTTKCDFTIVLCNWISEGIRFSEPYKRVYLNEKVFDKMKESGSTFDFVFLVMVIFEFLYERNKIYALWSAGFAKNNKGYLLFANTNGGKSNIVTLLSHKFGYGIAGDDRIALSIKAGKPYMVGGNNKLSFRSYGIPGYLSSKIHLEMDKKVRATPEDLFAKKFTGNAPIKMIFIVNIASVGSSSVSHIGDVQRYIYSNLSRVISGVEFSFMDSACAFPMMDSEKSRKGRFTFAKRLGKVRSYEVRGPIEYITKEIVRLIDSETQKLPVHR